MVPQMSKLRTASLFLAVGGGKFLSHFESKRNLRKLYSVELVCWGALVSVQAPFYPEEARKKGATVTQVSTAYQYLLLIFMNLLVFLQSGLSFSCVFISAFLTSVILTIIGGKLNVRKLAIASAILQGLVAMCFGPLEFVMELETFLALSYTLRYL